MEACPLSIRANLWRRMNSPIDQCIPPLSGGRVLLLFIAFNANIHHRPQQQRVLAQISAISQTVPRHWCAKIERIVARQGTDARSSSKKEKLCFRIHSRSTVSRATPTTRYVTSRDAQPPFYRRKTHSPMKFAYSHNASALILRTKWDVPTPAEISLCGFTQT